MLTVQIQEMQEQRLLDREGEGENWNENTKILNQIIQEQKNQILKLEHQNSEIKYNQDLKFRNELEKENKNKLMESMCINRLKMKNFFQLMKIEAIQKNH